jgi:release factor glutamine methyltransferase
MQFDKPLLEEELKILRELVKRALKQEPIEYILGHVSFYGCMIELTSDVLIPRQETEILLEKAHLRLKQRNLEGNVAWDLCAGSGCLGIGLKKALPQLAVTLCDISEKALAIARRNAKLNAVSVTCRMGDLLSACVGNKADIILCNPPYVSNKEYDELDRSVRGYEPKLALVGGEEGLSFYERLASELPEYLNPGAQLFFEMGCTQGKAIQNLFKSPHWRNRCIEKDLAGHERFFFLEFE